jgi:hypothetical protein
VPFYGRNWHGYLFRRTYDELTGLIRRAKAIYIPTGAIYTKNPPDFRWPNGATLGLRYLENDDDVMNYQGHEKTWLGFDELTNWKTSYLFDALKACLRWTEAEVPTKRIRASGNPGGPGHAWVKERFVDPCRTGYKLITDKYGPRMYIPSRIGDNKILMSIDPTYIDTLKLVGSETLVKAWLEGDWDIVLGAYFSNWRADKHVIPPFPIPAHWFKVGGFDWGSARPWCMLWAAISDGTVPNIPKGAMVVYRELYGGDRNAGWHWHGDRVGQHIAQIRDKTAYNVADPSIWTEQGGKCIAEMMGPYVQFKPADNSRIPGWDQVRYRLDGQGGQPLLYFFNTCVNTIRTLPLLQHDKHRPEDVDTDGEDHAPDVVRYLCMTRPLVKSLTSTPPIRGPERASLDEIWALTEKDNRDREWT